MKERIKMFDKIRRKSLGIKCAIDICQYENGVFCVKGWMFSDKRKMQRMQLVVEVGRVKYFESFETFGCIPGISDGKRKKKWILWGSTD